MGSAEELEALQRLGQQPAPEATCQPSAPGCQPAGEALHRAHCSTGETAMRNCCVNEQGVPDSQDSNAGAGSPSPAGKAPAPDGSSPAGKAPAPDGSSPAGKAPAPDGSSPAGKAPAPDGSSPAGKAPAPDGSSPAGKALAPDSSSSAGKTLAPDSSSPVAKAPEPSEGGAATSVATALPGSGGGTRLLEKSGESTLAPGNCSGQDGEAAPVGAVSSLAGVHSLPGSASPTEPADGPSPRPALEPCLKAPGKDSGSAPAPLKHVAFLEPAVRDALAGGTGAKPCPTPSALGPPHSLPDQALPSTEAVCPPDGMGLQGSAHEKAPASPAQPKAQLGPPADAVVGSLGDPAPCAPAPLVKEPAPGSPGETPRQADAALPEHAGQMGLPSPPCLSEPSPAGSPSTALEASLATAPKTDGAGKVGEPQAAASGEPWRGERAGAPRPALSKGCSFEVTPPPQDAGTQDTATQVDSRASLVSVAVSPINPPGSASAFPFQTRGHLVSVAVSPINPLDGASAFPFQSQGTSSATAPSSPVPAKKDAEMQVSMSVETRSVATGPMTPVSKSPQASYPEVRVKGAAEEVPEPIREVSWDEKGMTWEVYGAAMEVEVLGMAIQKHLEKQIEEHGRQMVLTPQSTRASSIKGAPRGKAKAKRPPSVFRALLQNVRRPRCCSRAGPAAE